MRRIVPILFASSLIIAVALAPAGHAAGDVKLTKDDNGSTSYVRYDGGTDETLQKCGSGRRPQNEPSVAVNPSDPDIVVAGSNDYCGQAVGGDTWVGYYRSTDGGDTWTNSLVPGYPTDASGAGAA